MPLSTAFSLSIFQLAIDFDGAAVPPGCTKTPGLHAQRLDVPCARSLKGRCADKKNFLALPAGLN